MILDAITESGTTYRIDVKEGLWVRIKDGQPQCSVQRTWALKVSNVRLTVGNLAWPKDGDGLWEAASVPVVGRNLYLAGRDCWFVTTAVVEVIERESWTA